MDEVDKQREYYARTAGSYESTCCFDKNDEHYMASAIVMGMLSHYGISSVLDVGCGTGRAIQYLQPKCEGVSFTGVEPVKELRDEAIKHGLAPEQVLEGDATHLDFADGQFDCVTIFGVLHHIPNPERAIKEVMRVSKKMVFISDHNLYGMGSPWTKRVKQCFRDLGLRRLLAFLLTKGKGYHDTTWDGVFYPFSIVDHFRLIQENMDSVYTFSTKTPAVNLYRDASHIGILGLKDPE